MFIIRLRTMAINCVNDAEADKELESIRFHTVQFRNAMDNTCFGQGAGNLKHFPSECCHHAAELLRHYLLENGHDGFEVISGNQPDKEYCHHQWLQKGDLVVDITADQFRLPKVIVTHCSPWHDSLNGSPLAPTNPNYEKELWEGNGGWTGYLPIYQHILENIDKISP